MTSIHMVTVEPNDFRGTPSVKFTCAGTRESDCHIYPDSEEWHEDDDQEHYPHDECWIQGWFDSESYAYYGPDSLDEGGPYGVPNSARSGVIEVEYEWGMGITWWWRGSKRA